MTNYCNAVSQARRNDRTRCSATPKRVCLARSRVGDEHWRTVPLRNLQFATSMEGPPSIALHTTTHRWPPCASARSTSISAGSPLTQVLGAREPRVQGAVLTACEKRSRMFVGDQD